MPGQCPGQDSRNLSVSFHLCPQCGKEVEMFSDEMRVKCPQCKTSVEKKTVPTCIQWCKQAKQCLGPDRWQKVMEALDTNDSQTTDGT